jgi:hypothetical protein
MSCVFTGVTTYRLVHVRNGWSELSLSIRRPIKNLRNNGVFLSPFEGIWTLSSE